MKKMFGILSIIALSVSLTMPAFASLDNANNKQVTVLDLGDLSVAGDVYGLYLPEKAVLTSVFVANSTGITADNTNYVTLAVMAGSATVASYDSRTAAQGALVANTPKAAIVSQGVVSAGSYLKVAFNKGGTGAMTKGKVFIQWYEK